MKINKTLALTILAMSLTTSVAFANFDAAEPKGNVEKATLESSRTWNGNASATAETGLYNTAESYPYTGIGMQVNGNKTSCCYSTGGSYARIGDTKGVEAFYAVHKSLRMYDDRDEGTVYTWVNN